MGAAAPEARVVPLDGLVSLGPDGGDDLAHDRLDAREVALRAPRGASGRLRTRVSRPRTSRAWRGICSIARDATLGDGRVAPGDGDGRGRCCGRRTRLRRRASVRLDGRGARRLPARLGERRLRSLRVHGRHAAPARCVRPAGRRRCLLRPRRDARGGRVRVSNMQAGRRARRHRRPLRARGLGGGARTRTGRGRRRRDLPSRLEARRGRAHLRGPRAMPPRFAGRWRRLPPGRHQRETRRPPGRPGPVGRHRPRHRPEAPARASLGPATSKSSGQRSGWDRARRSTSPSPYRSRSLTRTSRACTRSSAPGIRSPVLPVAPVPGPALPARPAHRMLAARSYRAPSIPSSRPFAVSGERQARRRSSCACGAPCAAPWRAPRETGSAGNRRQGHDSGTNPGSDGAR